MELQNLLANANDYSARLSERPTWENMEKAKKAIEQQLKLGHTFVIHNDDGKISSSITVSETGDEWNEIGKDGKALYFMKLIKDPDKADPNEAKALLKFSAKEAEKRKKEYLRCDVVSDHTRLISYYKSLGFKERGHFSYKQTREGILLEIPIIKLLNYIEG